jgi:hypothetical protein
MSETQRNSRLVKRGDVLRLTLPGGGEPYEDVVREVDIIIHMAGGVDHVVPGNAEVTVVTDEELSEQLRAQIEEMQNSEVS